MSKQTIAARHILRLLSAHRTSPIKSPSSTLAPLFIGMQGPQGVGKTTTAKALCESLCTPPNPLNVSVLCLDDFYLPYDGLKALSAKYPDNRLLSGRGQPGTHDLGLLRQTLLDLSLINENISVPVPVPIFDKSLFGGYGNRSSSRTTVNGPIDVVLLEGWCMGFYPLPREELRLKYDLYARGEDLQDSSTTEDAQDKLPEMKLAVEIIKTLSFKHIEQINDSLHMYTELLYPFFSGFIQFAPPAAHPYSQIYNWRLEQEHWMKSHNGGKGMSDEEVKLFIDRYIPGYAFFLNGIQDGYIGAPISDGTSSSNAQNPPWKDNGIRLFLNLGRDVEGLDSF